MQRTGRCFSDGTSAPLSYDGVPHCEVVEVVTLRDLPPTARLLRTRSFRSESRMALLMSATLVVSESIRTRICAGWRGGVPPPALSHTDIFERRTQVLAARSCWAI